jgi:hypothetical protein
MDHGISHVHHVNNTKVRLMKRARRLDKLTSRDYIVTSHIVHPNYNDSSMHKKSKRVCYIMLLNLQHDVI